VSLPIWSGVASAGNYETCSSTNLPSLSRWLSGGAIVLLLVGTQILNWYWPVLLYVGALAVGIWRAKSKILSSYQVAQSIDNQLGLHDSLSTAFFFGEHPTPEIYPAEFVEQQRAVAEDMARTADLQRGIPFHMPRTLYANAFLLAAVCGMFGLRYGVNHNMDLRSSLVPISFDGFLGPSAKELAAMKKIAGQHPFDQDGHRENGMAVDPWQSKDANLDPASDTALQTTQVPDANNPDGGAEAAAKGTASGNDPQQQPGEDAMDSGDKGQNSPPGKDANGNDSNASPDGNSQDGKQSPKDGSQSSNSGENSSLTDKMKDALANLMSKLKMQPKQDGKQGGQSQQKGQQSAQKQGQQDSNGSQSQGKEQADGNSSAQSQGDQQSQNGQQQSAQGQSQGKNSEKANTQDGKSGIGKQDGDKTAREAEQLAAMGKISEIIGKRSANVSGEVMVEVASGKQQLKTQYSQRKAAHAEAGGEINRDEVPLAYQQYVQQYFEEIRKQPAAKAKAPGDPKTKTSGN
jgi:hypothetical protein